MRSQIIALRVASVVFGLSCLAHVARLLARLELHIGATRLGYFPSLVAIVVAGGLSLWMWNTSCAAPKTPPAQGS